MPVSMMEPPLHTFEGQQGQVPDDEALRASVDNLRLHSRAEVGGEGQNRTVDTTIFSHSTVLFAETS